MSAVKSIQTVGDRLAELEHEIVAKFVRQYPDDPLAVEASVLVDAKRRLSQIAPAAGTANGSSSAYATGVNATPRKGKQPKGRVAQHEGAELAVRAAGHPLTTSELVVVMPKHGAAIGGPNAERNLTSILWKRGNLHSIRWREKRAWWFKGEKVPE